MTFLLQALDNVYVVLPLLLVTIIIIFLIKIINRRQMKQNPVDYDKFKKTIKIALIEDKKSTFPLQNFLDDLYSITHIKKVKQKELDDLCNGEFEIIILDILDIVDNSLIKNGGVGILERVKRKSPNTSIIICSGSTFTTADLQILKKADGTIEKPVIYTDARDVVDFIIRSRYLYMNEFKKLKQVIQNKIPDENKEVVNGLIISMGSNKITRDEFIHNLNSLKISASSIRDILILINTIFS